MYAKISLWVWRLIMVACGVWAIGVARDVESARVAVDRDRCALQRAQLEFEKDVQLGLKTAAEPRTSAFSTAQIERAKAQGRALDAVIAKCPAWWWDADATKAGHYVSLGSPAGQAMLKGTSP